MIPGIEFVSYRNRTKQLVNVGFVTAFNIFEVSWLLKKKRILIFYLPEKRKPRKTSDTSGLLCTCVLDMVKGR